MSVTGNVLRGLNHAFSNRLSSLGAVGAGLGAPEDGPVGAQVDAEAERLERLLRLYRLLPFASGVPEPAQVTCAADDALALFQYHLAFRDVPCEVDGDPTTPPVLLNPATLMQAVLLLLCAAARHLGEETMPEGIRLRYEGNADAVELVAETNAVASLGGDEPPELRALRWIARDAAVEAAVAVTPRGTVRATLRLGTLAFLRRRERGG